MKIGKLFILIVGLIVFSSIISSATNTCDVVLKNNCNSKRTILYLYDNQNSHGAEHWESNAEFSYALCCNFDESKTCRDSNEILALSSTSNAHAEISSLNNYNRQVCYGDLECIVQSSNTPPDDYPIKMLSLSSNTNAHVVAYSDYAWKISCRHKPKNSPSILGNSASVWSTYSLNLNYSQLGTSSAKVQIKATNINAAQGTPIYFEIYARHLYNSGIPATFTGTFIKMLGNAIFTFSSSPSLSTSSATTSYVYTPIRTGINNITGYLEANGNVYVDWTITQSDLSKAGTGSVYEFTYKILAGAESKTFYDKILTLNMKTNPPYAGIVQKWLDGDKLTIILKKIMNWNLLVLGGSNNGEIVPSNTGNQVMTANVINLGPTYPTNLVYMSATNMPASAVGKRVYFEIYESDAGEDGVDDLVRVGSSAINVIAESPGKAVAPWYVLKSDIAKAISGDQINPEGTIDFEFYYKIKYWNGNAYIYATVDNLLKLTITNYPVSINTTNIYLNYSEGIWTDKDFTQQISSFDYVEGSDNTVGMYVGNISASAYGDTLYFHIYGINGTDGSYVPIIADNSLSSVVNNQGEAYTTWTIDSSDLQVTGSSDTNYEFFYNAVLNDEKKSFDNNILDVNVQESSGGGGNGGDECDDIFYCSDYTTRTKCESNICDNVISNENSLNSLLDCTFSNCYCYWENGECNFGYDSEFSDLGTCTYTKGEVQDNCVTNGVVITFYSASWVWDAGNCYNSSNCSNNLLIGQSCANLDGCWRIINSSYTSCKDYEEYVECSSGTGVGGSGIPTNTKLKWLWIILIIGIVVLGFVIYLVARKIMKDKMIKKLFKTKENYNSILNYISKARQQKLPEQEIRRNLLGAGWNSDQIEFAFKHSHKVKVK